MRKYSINIHVKNDLDYIYRVHVSDGYYKLTHIYGKSQYGDRMSGFHYFAKVGFLYNGLAYTCIIGDVNTLGPFFKHDP